MTVKSADKSARIVVRVRLGEDVCVIGVRVGVGPMEFQL